jgi:hypothetical protein
MHRHTYIHTHSHTDTDGHTHTHTHTHTDREEEERERDLRLIKMCSSYVGLIKQKLLHAGTRSPARSRRWYLWRVGRGGGE